ncbi:MAG: acyl-CoA carboxylase epsilon subunit [Pseudonocardiaceae bacterium]
MAEIRIVRGAPNDDETAAVLVVLHALLRENRDRGADPSRTRAPWARGARYRPPGAWTHAAAGRFPPRDASHGELPPAITRVRSTRCIPSPSARSVTMIAKGVE